MKSAPKNINVHLPQYVLHRYKGVINPATGQPLMEPVGIAPTLQLALDMAKANNITAFGIQMTLSVWEQDLPAFTPKGPLGLGLPETEQ